MDNIETGKSRIRNRVFLLLVVALFVLPFIVANWVFKRTVETEVWNTTNRGMLIQPARPAQEFELLDQAGGRYTTERFRGHWTLVFVPSSPCDEVCKKNIYHMRQVWISLGREANRLQRLLVVASEEEKLNLVEFLQAYPQTDVVVDSDAHLSSQIEFAKQIDEPAIMLVDPLGNLMMAFSQSMDPRDILKDLRKLFKISQVG